MSFVNRRYTKGVPFLSKMVCKRIRGWGMERLVDPLRITLCWVLPWPIGLSLRPAAWSCVFFCCLFFSHLCCLLFLVFNWNASIFLVTKSSVSSASLYKFDISHVTHHMSALDQLKHSCTINWGGSSFPVLVRESLSNFVKNLQTSSCFYRSSKHGLTHSSRQVFNYVAVTKL